MGGRLALVALFVTLAVPAAVGLVPLGPQCVPSCDVSATQFGNVAPAVLVTTGATVMWSSGDGARHTSTSDDRCIDVSILRDVPGAASFLVRGGALIAVDPLDGTEAPCAEATAVGADAFALSYHCSIHATLQQGVLVVVSGPS